jgi:17beta-estradiol 17-dehydrogenase / 3alpha(17beta)-hydroxysteroid dehydrogenase (NAD+) / 3-oxoacyl-[acyl-carrier protein] reductase alpha subunit
MLKSILFHIFYRILMSARCTIFFRDMKISADTSCEYTFVSDVSQRQSVITLADEIFSRTQTYPTLIVNAAGITRDALLLKMRDEDFDDVIRVNLKGTYLINQIFCQRLLAQKPVDLKASIINIASIVGKYGNVGQCNYTASKAGVEAMTKSMAKELGRIGIRVNAVLPGFIETPMTDKIPEKIKEKLVSSIAMGRMGTVDDIAQVCLFLASNKMSAYVNGASIDVTGGL